VHCDWSTCGDAALTITNCPSSLDAEEPMLTLQRTAPFDAAADEETVESSFFPGTMVPPDVEKSLAALLSMETVKWIEEHDANGHASEGIWINEQYIPADMKDAIKSYVKKYAAEPHMQGTKGPVIDEATAVRDRGTNVESPQSDSQRRLLDLDCHPQHSLEMPAPLVSPVEKWTKQLCDVILRREILMAGLGVVLTVSSVSALLFVYGVSDVWSGILSFWYSTRNAVERFRQSVHEDLPRQCDEQQLSMEKSPSKQNGKHNARVKNKDVCMNGKSASKKRNKSHPSPKPRNDQTDATYKKDTRKDKKTLTKGKQMKGRSEDEHDENNDWQEVMHSKQKGRSVRPKQVLEEEEKIFPQPKPAPARQPTSQPVTPKTPELQHQPPTAIKSEECVTPAIKPIKTNSHSAVHKEPWSAVEDPNENLHLTMTTSGAFDERSLTNRFAMSQMPFSDTQFVQQSPVQQSPFAASTDLPFFNSSPVRGGYPGIQSPTTEEQFQSKVDCLLRNLRSKPFSVHPVSSSPHHPLRRSVTDLEEQVLVNRLTALNLQHSMSGSLDPAFSASGMLNNRLTPAFLQPQLTDDIRMTRQMSGGLSLTRPSRLMSQRAVSLPLAPPQNQTGFPLCSQGSMKTCPKNPHTLSNDCSLFSSNPSIWSVDLAVDRDLVKSSMPNNARFKTSAFASEEQSLDFKRCLPDQLLTEMGSLNES